MLFIGSVQLCALDLTAYSVNYCLCQAICELLVRWRVSERRWGFTGGPIFNGFGYLNLIHFNSPDSPLDTETTVPVCHCVDLYRTWISWLLLYQPPMWHTLHCKACSCMVQYNLYLIPSDSVRSESSPFFLSSQRLTSTVDVVGLKLRLAMMYFIVQIVPEVWR